MHTDKLERLAGILRKHQPLVVAYSGGVDSAFLLAAAHRELGPNALGVIADSPSLPRRALEEALEIAQQIGAPAEVIKTAEIDDPRYAANPANRCYFCKAELFNQLDQIAQERGFRAVAYGENADDAAMIRPGALAAGEFCVIAPLRDAGLTKAEIRNLSRAFGLPTADKPAQPCLSSRIPHGTPVTREALAMIEKAEEALRTLGFVEFRVRHIAPTRALPSARVQIAPAEMHRVAGLEPRMRIEIKACGYAGVEIDPEGYRPPPKLSHAEIKAALENLPVSTA